MEKNSWKDADWETPEIKEEPVSGVKRSRDEVTAMAIDVIAGKADCETADQEVLDVANDILLGKWFSTDPR